MLESDPGDNTSNWVLPEGHPTAVLVSERETEKKKKMSGRGRGHSKKSSKKSGDVYLTNYEKELLDWACNGFLPHGAEGIWPSKADQEELEQHVGPVPAAQGRKAIRDPPPAEQPARKKAKGKVTKDQVATKPMIRGW